MKKNYVLFFDSGLGGISTLKEALSLYKTNYIYFGDTLHSPYGNHNKKEICLYLKQIILDLQKKYCIKIVVLACNTATTSAIKFLRKIFPEITFIGTEPAINLAKKNGYNKILTIATPTTIKQKKFKLLVKSLNIKHKNLPLEHFATKIENYFNEKTIFNNFELIKEIYKIKKVSKNYESLILGCTHYCLIKSKIKHYINKPIFDGNFGTAKMLVSKIEKLYSKEFKSKTKATVKLIISSKNPAQTQKYTKILKQILAINYKMW